jgi:Trypsin-like peptidase domain
MKKIFSTIPIFIGCVLSSWNLFGQNFGLSSGSGFAISSNGYLVTNSHVIADAKFIAVQQYIDGELITFKAKVVKDDEKNDIAILKIDDSNFKGFGVIPYTIKTQTVEKGSEVFTMGYPRIDVLGEEVKITKGNIVSLTGIQGDAGHYQIQAPIDHGNSGGPLFDNDGNIIGITDGGNSTGVTPVYYAIKISKLITLTDLLPEQIKLPITNSVKSFTLPQKVKAFEKFVFLIKAVSSLPPTPAQKASIQSKTPDTKIPTESNIKVPSNENPNIKNVDEPALSFTKKHRSVSLILGVSSLFGGLPKFTYQNTKSSYGAFAISLDWGFSKSLSFNIRPGIISYNTGQTIGTREFKNNLMIYGVQSGISYHFVTANKVDPYLSVNASYLKSNQNSLRTSFSPCIFFGVKINSKNKKALLVEAGYDTFSYLKIGYSFGGRK